MLHKEFWGLLFLAFVVWIFMAGDGSTRIARGCRPIAWGGNVVVSLTALALPNQQSGVKRWVDKVEYGCQYTAWRLFYQDDYNKALEAQERQAQLAQGGESGEQSAPTVPAELPKGVQAPPVKPVSEAAAKQ